MAECNGDSCTTQCHSGQTSVTPNAGAGNAPNCNGCQDNCVVCSSHCGGGCTGGCSSGCGNSCGGCSGGCSGCSGTCSRGCSGDCYNACARGCSNSCTEGCTKGCAGQCNYGCQNEEVDSLYAQLNLQRIAKNADINLMKKIIYRLFEIKNQSDLKDGKTYISEYKITDKDIYGLIPNTTENEDETFTLQLAFTKTIQNIIDNLNNVNSNRVSIDKDKVKPATDSATGITYDIIDSESALYWVKCLQNIYNTVAPISSTTKQ